MRACLVLAILVMPLFCDAATWRVEKDDTGDFAVIQDAVDAAADGDSIYIGRGRFTDGLYTNGSVLVVSKNDLTLIGEGAGLSTIGPEIPWTLESGFTDGIICGLPFGSDVVTIVGIKFENMGTGINADNCSMASVSACEFFSNAKSIYSYVGNTRIENCNFEFTARNNYHVLSHSQESAVIDNCTFLLSSDTGWPQTQVHHEGTVSSHISNCEFIGGEAGIVSSSSSPVETDNCQFTGMSHNAFLGYYGSLHIIKDCFVSHCSNAFVSYSSEGNWNVERVTVTDAVAATLQYRDPILGYMRDNIFSKGPQFVAERRSEFEKPESHFDMTNNWWGTTDPDSIAAWILDANDLPVTGQIIDFVPFKQRPVKAEQKSWGQMKNMFR